MAIKVCTILLGYFATDEETHYKTTTLGPRLCPRFYFGTSLGGALVAPRHHQGITKAL